MDAHAQDVSVHKENCGVALDLLMQGERRVVEEKKKGQKEKKGKKAVCFALGLAQPS